MDGQNRIWCEYVEVKTSTLSTDENRFFGAFASKDFKKGDTIEIGLMKVLPESFDGMKNQFVFTWSDNIPNKTWAFGSGCATFYNCASNKDMENTEMIRNFDNNSFKIIAAKDIKKGDELFHTYKSLQWRECFQDIKEIANKSSTL